MDIKIKEHVERTVRLTITDVKRKEKSKSIVFSSGTPALIIEELKKVLANTEASIPAQKINPLDGVSINKVYATARSYPPNEPSVSLTVHGYSPSELYSIFWEAVKK